jgi:protein-L-isoaspartate(D-aspartate) O-methyltransferase
MTDPYVAERERMVEDQLVARGIRSPAVLEAMAQIPRHLFVPPELAARAYADSALPIAGGQTISQPYIVALMTEALAPSRDERILEIGTGSGYQTAVLAELAGEVFTIERHAELADAARGTLAELGYGNVRFRTGDGTLGWSESAPYHGVLVAAGAPALPAELGTQLRSGGRLIVPVGTLREQDLYRYWKEGDRLRPEWLTRCRFVPLVGEEGWGGAGPD